MIREEIRSAFEEVGVPTGETIAEIVRRESEANADLESKLRDEIQSQIDEKLTAFSESEKMLKDIEAKLSTFKTELDGVEEEEERIHQKFAHLFEGPTFQNAVDAVVEKRLAETDRPSTERVGEMIQEVAAERSRELEEKLRQEFEHKLANGGGSSSSDAPEGEGFRDAVVALIQEEAEKFKGSEGDLTETITSIAGSTTEKILAREAEGLVRQIKIELGKVRNDMGKSWEKTQALMKSPEMKQQIEEVAKEQIATVAKELGGGPGEDQVREMVEDISTGIAEQVAQDSLKGFLDELRNRVEAGFDTRLNEFMDSDDLKKAVGAIASEAVTAGGGGGGDGDGGADGLGADAIRKIVSDEIMRRTDEAFQDLIPRHVGKFLDEKLPPPEFFQSLATMVQVKQEIEKNLAGSRSGSGARAFSGPGPGDSAIFSNMIGRLLGSDELKEMIDDKFRVINGYIKSELIPKTIKKMKKDGQL
ncbi:MAG: hypothetical protein ACYTFG_18425 [Planctomycetota bacterium]|jgi:hypothetical protein